MDSIRPAEILLVEDDSADIRLAQEAMQDGKLNERLHVVMNGTTHFSFLWRESRYAAVPCPDMLLLDLSLPKMREVLAGLKVDPNLKRMPVAVLTASRTDTEIVKRFGLPMQCYIVKPLEFARYECNGFRNFRPRL